MNKALTTQITLRFAGDSGDGVQTTGQQLAQASALLGNDIHTLPDFPAEIRAPAGTVSGVSGFQLCFSNTPVHTLGDTLDALIAFNPAALKVSLPLLKLTGLLILDANKFTEKQWQRAGYTENPLENLQTKYQLIAVPISNLTLELTENLTLTRPKKLKAKNMFALGMVFWIYDRTLKATLDWIEEKFTHEPEVQKANTLALKAGYHYAQTAEIATRQIVGKANLPKGQYRTLTGNQGICLAAIYASQQCNYGLLAASYPITPASDILIELAKYPQLGVKTFQAEDEIASICACIGAAFGGALSITATSGPGFDLKAESLGLACILELPLVVVNVQRAGPATGMPTKPEQSDFFAAVYGRHGETPIPVLAPATPAECFSLTLKAFQIAITYMTPVIILSDAYLANSAQAWQIPEVNTLPSLNLAYEKNPPAHFNPYQRDPKTGARPWVIPGTPKGMHRIGSLEKDLHTGEVSYDPINHEKMTQVRAKKLDNLAKTLPAPEVFGPSSGKLLLISWGSTQGAVQTAYETLSQNTKSLAYLHLTYLNPLPVGLADILKKYHTILVAELNTGQLTEYLKAKTRSRVQCLSKVQGRPFRVLEIISSVASCLGDVPDSGNASESQAGSDPFGDIPPESRLKPFGDVPPESRLKPFGDVPPENPFGDIPPESLRDSCPPSKGGK